MSDKREQMAEIVTVAKDTAKRGISKIATIGFIGALIVLVICSAPFALGAWWLSQDTPQHPVTQPSPYCGADEWLGWADTAEGRRYFCTPKW